MAVEEPEHRGFEEEAMNSRVPILVILGATGTGKSRLGIELARRFRGEIVSADSMQVYKGLDIITAKVTKEEQAMAPHHMIDVVDPLNEFTVIDFRNKALKIMDNLIQSKKIPIVVGGTNYYIESLIWQILVDQPKLPDCDIVSDKESTTKIRREPDMSNEELHRKLIEVDPDRAMCIHPNDRRKTIRSLEVFEQHGTTHTEILRQQRLAGGCRLGGPLRHENSIILWLTCNKEVRDRRLNARVDSMLEAGLVQELLDFHERYNKDRINKNELPNYTRGIFQSIGFKEFHNYLILPKEERDLETGKRLLEEAVENLKLVTRRYAKKQDKWVKNRLIQRPDRQVPPIYALDCTDVEQWESEVYGKAEEIVSSLMRGETPSFPAANSRDAVNPDNFVDPGVGTFKFCEVCQRYFVNQLQWDVHLEGYRHRKAVKRKMKEEWESNNAKKSVSDEMAVNPPLINSELEEKVVLDYEKVVEKG